jgi:aminoglycoside 6'-N-acetyltransferase
VRELDAASRHVGLAAGHLELGGLVHLFAWFLVTGDTAGKHQGLRLGAALRETALHEQHVDPFLHVPMIAVVTSLQGELVRLRPLRREDAPHLAEIGSHPEIARWWPDITVEELVAKAEGRDDVEAFAIEHDGELVGLGQIYEHSNPEYRHAGIDLFLAPQLHGRGLGRDTVRTLARWLVEERGHHRVVIDPAAANEKAIRCYEAVGFRRIGVLRRYWRDPDGVWQDGLLLDLLAEEL